MIFSRDQLVRAFPNQPLLVAQMEELGSLVDEARSTLDALKEALATVQGAVEAEGRWQPASTLLSQLEALNGQTGVLVLFGADNLGLQSIDLDDGSLITRGTADTRYAPHP